MKRKKGPVYALCIGVPLAVGALSSIITQNGMPRYELAIKPSFTPPSVLFPIVWTLLYILMGVGMARVWLTGAPGRRRAALLFAVQLAVNFLWTVWFFGLGAYGLAFWWLLLLMGLVVWMLLVFRRIDQAAGYLQIPYALWCAFAALLSRAIWLFNR